MPGDPKKPEHHRGTRQLELSEMQAFKVTKVVTLQNKSKITLFASASTILGEKSKHALSVETTNLSLKLEHWPTLTTTNSFQMLLGRNIPRGPIELLQRSTQLHLGAVSCQ